MVDNLASYFNGRRILITGHTGFKGSWLSFWLTRIGAEVCGYALPPESSYGHFQLLNLENQIKHVVGDIRDHDSVQRCFDRFKPEVVFHLAAQPLVRLSYEQPKDTFDTNVSGSVNILEACRNTKTVKALIYVTSDKCYKNNEWIWGYRENDELGGFDPYSASKAAAEMVFHAYCKSFYDHRPNFGAASVRAGNVIGGGDWAEDRIVPDCIRALLANTSIGIRNPKSTRPWQHVLEPLHGYLMLAARLLEYPREFSGSWNFGPSTSSVMTVKDFVDRVISAWGKGDYQLLTNTSAVHEARLLHLSCDKAHQLLNWFPIWNADQSIVETIYWYQSVIVDGTKANIVSAAQIDKYMEQR